MRPRFGGLPILERYNLIDADHINYEVTIEDPKVFTRPWKMSMILYRHKERNFRLLEYECYGFDFEPYYPYPGGTHNLTNPMTGGADFNNRITGAVVRNPSRIVDPPDGQIPYR